LSDVKMASRNDEDVNATVENAAYFAFFKDPNTAALAAEHPDAALQQLESIEAARIKQRSSATATSAGGKKRKRARSFRDFFSNSLPGRSKRKIRKRRAAAAAELEAYEDAAASPLGRTVSW